MQKPIIACDMDGVYSHWFEQLVLTYNSMFGTKFRVEDNTDHDILIGLGLEKSKFDLIINNSTIRHRICQNTNPIEGSLENSSILERDYEIVITTSRNQIFDEPAEVWLSRYHKDYRVIYASGSGNPYGNLGMRSKIDIANEIGAIALIDDNPHEFIDWDHPTIKPICFRHKWNECLLGDLSPDIPRLNWPEIVEYFAQLTCPR